jgi:hypothetical protein
MLYVKFYMSFILLFGNICVCTRIMIMLPLRIYRLCDIINGHLFESFYKNKKIQLKKENDPTCEVGRVYFI